MASDVSPIAAADLVIRQIRPSDKACLADAVQRLSPRSAHARFLSPKPRLTAAELRYLTEVDHVHHEALVAALASSPAELIAVGRWVRDPERPDHAELAIVVADELQGRGIGTHLGRALAQAALERGITTLTASALEENVAARRLLARVAQDVRVARSGGVTELAGTLHAA